MGTRREGRNVCRSDATSVREDMRLLVIIIVES